MRRQYDIAGVSYEDDAPPSYPSPDQEMRRPVGQPATPTPQDPEPSSKTYGLGLKKGGMVKKAKPKAKASSASKRGDGCAQRGKTKGRMV